jgi:hypothetical protein
MGIAYIVGFSIYFFKKYKKRKLKAKVAAGLVPPKEKKPKGPQENIIIPPDPAVVLGQRLPGERVFVEKSHSSEGNGDAKSKAHLPPHRDNKKKSSADSHVPSATTPIINQQKGESVEKIDEFDQ